MHKIKVCGLRNPENIQAISKLPVQYLGFIFYSKSPRYVGAKFDSDILKELPESIQKVGVFVNEEGEKMQRIHRQYHLNYLQLHGTETPDLCQRLKQSGIAVIKAFQMDVDFDFTLLDEYRDVVDYFLFDTRSGQYGGSGHKFDWRLLEKYQGNIPLFLSGGIGPADAKAIQELQHPQLFALDVNSGFEDYPGFKNISKLKKFLIGLNQEGHKG